MGPMTASHRKLLELLMESEWHFHKTIEPALYLYDKIDPRNKELYGGLIPYLFVNLGDISGDADTVVEMRFYSKDKKNRYDILFTYETIEVRRKVVDLKKNKTGIIESRYFSLNCPEDLVQFLTGVYHEPPDPRKRGCRIVPLDD